MRLVVIFALAVAACSSSPKPGGDGGGGGSGGSDLSTSGTADLAPRSIVGLACGTDTCILNAQLCCTGDSGNTGECQFVSSAACGTAQFLCDGPEDCEPANPQCCIVSNGVASCCAPQGGETFMCHFEADCPTGLHCCSPPTPSPYKICVAKAC